VAIRARLSQETQPADPATATQTATKGYVDGLAVALATTGASQFPATIGTSNTVGTGTVSARYDHIHRERQATLDRITALEAPAVALADAATIATDASLGRYFRVTLGGNRTLGAPTNPVDGQRVVWEFIQDATGTRTLALNAVFALGTDIATVTLTTTASKRDFLGAIYNSTAAKWYVLAFVKGY
jgi:hypothetical protein